MDRLPVCVVVLLEVGRVDRWSVEIGMPDTEMAWAPGGAPAARSLGAREGGLGVAAAGTPFAPLPGGGAGAATMSVPPVNL